MVAQRHVRDTPVFLAFCADLTRIEHVVRERGHDIEDNNLEIGLVSSIDAALVGMSAYLAADSLGLKGVMIGAVRNDAVETARILGLNAASLYGIDPAITTCQPSPADRAALRREIDDRGVHGPMTAAEARGTFDREHPWFRT